MASRQPSENLFSSMGEQEAGDEYTYAPGLKPASGVWEHQNSWPKPYQYDARSGPASQPRSVPPFSSSSISLGFTTFSGGSLTTPDPTNQPLEQPTAQEFPGTLEHDFNGERRPEERDVMDSNVSRANNGPDDIVFQHFGSWAPVSNATELAMTDSDGTTTAPLSNNGESSTAAGRQAPKPPTVRSSHNKKRSKKGGPQKRSTRTTVSARNSQARQQSSSYAGPSYTSTSLSHDEVSEERTDPEARYKDQEGSDH